MFTGLGDDNSFDASFLGGSVLTAFVLGLGVIIAAKTVLKPQPKRRWVDGAWRRADYETRSRDFGVRPKRRRK